MAKIFDEKRNFYFRNFPLIDYTLEGETKQVLNFIHRWAFNDSVKNNISSWSKWIIRDEDTLFSIAEKLYGSQHQYWIIMMMNDMMDPFFDWPLNETDLKKYIISIYGVENIYNTHHWEAEEDDDLYSVPAGTKVSIDYPYNKVSVSNYDYESILNENKRFIKLLKPSLLGKVLKEKDKILSENFGL